MGLSGINQTIFSMNKLFVAVLLFAGLGANAQNAEQMKVNQSLVKLFDALAALDMKTIRDFSTGDLTILESGVVWNLDTLARKVDQLQGASFSRTNHLDFIQTEIKGNTAWSIYYNSADMIIDGLEVHRKWLESAVLLKEGKVWKVKLLHSTIMKSKKE
jgi:ketosteroid isomerase-like protein